MSRALRSLALVLFWTALGLPATATQALGSDNLGASVTLATDYVLRGISQTRGDPAIQGGFHFEHPSGIFAGAWASNVEFPDRFGQGRGRDLELDTYVGYGLDLSPRWAVVATLVHYDYPGADTTFDYEYEEGSLSLQSADRWTVGVSFTDDAFGFGEQALIYELTGRHPLSTDLDLTAGVGYYDLDRTFGTTYWFWNVGLGRTWNRFSLELGWFGTSDEAGAIWGDLADDRLVLTLTAAVR